MSDWFNKNKSGNPQPGQQPVASNSQSSQNQQAISPELLKFLREKHAFYKQAGLPDETVFGLLEKESQVHVAAIKAAFSQPVQTPQVPQVPAPQPQVVPQTLPFAPVHTNGNGNIPPPAPLQTGPVVSSFTPPTKVGLAQIAGKLNKPLTEMQAELEEIQRTQGT